MSKKQNKEGAKKEIKGTKSNMFENQEERLKKEKESLQIIYQENMHRYMKQLEAQHQDQKSAHYSLESIDKISHHLQAGDLIIPQSAIPLPQKIQKPPKLTYEQQKQSQIKTKRDNIQRKIQYINEQLKVQSQLSKQRKIENKPIVKQIYTKQQHERKVQQILQQKQQRKKRQQELKEEQERKQKEQQERRQQQRQQQELAKQKKKGQIQEKIKKRKKQHEQFVERATVNPSNHNYLYEKMQNNFNANVAMPLLEEKKNKLKQIREFNKQYEIDAVKLHQKNYQAQSLQKSTLKKTKDNQWKYQAPSRVERLSGYLQQEEKELRQKLEYRKHRIEEMKEAHEAFNIKLKMYKPKVDQQKRREIQSRIEEEIRIQQNKKIEYDERKIGLEYLQAAKKMKRSETVRAKLQTVQKMQRVQSHKYLQSSRVARSESFYEDLRRKKIQEIINSEENNHEKYKMLKMESEKLENKIKQKDELHKHGGTNSHEEAQLLVTNIKAKFGLINLMKTPANTKNP